MLRPRLQKLPVPDFPVHLMFLYYNNRAGCVRSLLISVIATLALCALLWLVNTHR